MTDRLEDVEAALRAVRDPTLEMDVFDAGLIEELHLDGDVVTIEADLSSFDEPAAADVMAALIDAAGSVEGIDHAYVEQSGVDTAARPAGFANASRILAIASAKGGVGKSTVAVHLACSLAGQETVGLFDADIHGPNLPSLLGVEGPVFADDDGHPMPVEVNGLRVMSVGLMEEGGPLAWRGAMAHDVLSDLFQTTAWGAIDTLVIDLPPGTGDVVLTTLQDVPVDGVVVVTTPFHAAMTDTGRTIELFQENDVPVLGVVSNMARFQCPTCGDDHPLYSRDVPIEELGVPVLAEIPFSHELQARPEPGQTPTEFTPVVTRLEERYKAIWDVAVPDGAVDLRNLPAHERHDVVRAAFEQLTSDDTLVIVSDRDPSPVRGYLADLADSDDADEPFEEVRLRQPNPETWILELTLRD
jgi:ATP-binding protein involved in chromosome partitioning